MSGNPHPGVWYIRNPGSTTLRGRVALWHLADLGIEELPEHLRLEGYHCTTARYFLELFLRDVLEVLEDLELCDEI